MVLFFVTVLEKETSYCTSGANHSRLLYNKNVHKSYHFDVGTLGT